MQIKFAKDETVLKSWDYAKAGHRFDKHKKECNLTITNKRIITSKENKYSLERTELNIKDAQGITGSYRRNDSFWVKVKYYFTLILSFVIIGIPFFLKAREQMKACFLELEIQTNTGRGSSLQLGANTGDNVKRFHFFGNSYINKFKVYVDKDLAREILDEIGAIIVDAKA